MRDLRFKHSDVLPDSISKCGTDILCVVRAVIHHGQQNAKSYARSVGLNLDGTATECWDNPITAGPHSTCLERDIQSRLNRYGKDEEITDVWIWAVPLGNGSYDLYIGYA